MMVYVEYYVRRWATGNRHEGEDKRTCSIINFQGSFSSSRVLLPALVGNKPVSINHLLESCTKGEK